MGIKCLMSKDLTFKRQKKGGRTVHLHIELRELQHSTRNYIDLSPVNIDQGVVVSISGHIRGSGSGQIIEKFEDYIPFFANSDIDSAKKIADIWRNYHLNDLQAGTKLQQDTLEENRNEWYKKNEDNYARKKEFLEYRNLLIDRDYKYGTGWLYKPVPQEIIDFLYSL